MSVKSRRGVFILILALLVPTSCGAPTVTSQSDPAPSPTDFARSPSKDQLYEGTGLVLDDGDPLICFGGSTDSAPPQCEGPELRGWTWDGLEFDEMAGTKWGRFTVRGTYVDRVFTLKGIPTEPKPYEEGSSKSPCPEPAGGWSIPDPSRTSEEDRLSATRAAESQPDFAGAWIDYIVEPQTEEEALAGENVALILAFTGDAERHEDEAREHWGGALCIWTNNRTYKDLKRIQEELGGGWPEEFGIETTWSGIDIKAGMVELGAIISTPAFEAELGERYGENAVKVHPALQPVG
jgi:hypothetical protein